MTASGAHHATLAWPRGTTRNAASSGPNEEPRLPPTWKNDCAKPCRPPDAIRAMRDDSGWKIDEPMPIRPAATSKASNVPAADSSRTPTSVNVMPTTSAYGVGRRSVYRPTSGCSSDAVSCSVNVISPTCVNDSANAALNIGYNAGTSAWIVSFSRWDRLAPASTAKAVAPRSAVAAGAYVEVEGTAAMVVIVRASRRLEQANPRMGYLNCRSRRGTSLEYFGGAVSTEASTSTH